MEVAAAPPPPPAAGGISATTATGVLSRVRNAILAGSRWRRAVTSMVFGALTAAAFAPLHAWFVLIPAFIVLYWLAAGARSVGSAAAAGWWFGLGHFAAGLYWVANALMTFPERFGWLAPFAVLGLAALLALFPALAAAVTRATRTSGIGGVLVFAGMWTASEWLRAYAFTGFPWNLVGSAWAFSAPMIQIAGLVGTYGLGLVTVVAAAMPAVLADGRGHRRFVAVAIACGALVAVWAGGAWRLSDADPGVVDGVHFRLVQPAIDQRLKWKRELRREHVLGQTRLALTPAERPPTHVIWSETAAPAMLSAEPELVALISSSTPADGVSVVGTLRRTPAGEALRIWNSLAAIDATGRFVGGYDKAHLVPFGEYVPFRSILGLAKVTAGATDFSAGPGVTTLRLPGLPPVSPLICYEVIFPAQVVDRQDRPSWLLNLTNDGWYGISAGPYQHLAAARMRAVEEGLPLVRVANNGISAIIDAYGRTVVSLGLGKRGIVDGPLPKAVPTPTPYGRLGDWIVGLLIIAALAAGIGMGSVRQT